MSEPPTNPGLSSLEKLFLGAVGGAAALLLTYPAFTGYLHVPNMTTQELMGCLARVVIGAIGGAFYVYLNLAKPAEDRIEVFKRGLAAPGIIAGMITLHSPPTDRPIGTALDLSISSSAYAATNPIKPEPDDGLARVPKPPTSWDLFIKGLLGK